jgi:hypothetical protein
MALKEATKGKTPARRPVRATRPDTDAKRLEQWFAEFDVKMADLSARQDALLRSLGVEPAHRDVESID